jgi:alpha-tubulin suppressor-like RCC1 family protein
MASLLGKSILIFWGIIMLWWPAAGAAADLASRLAVGGCHTLAFKKDGLLWAWGRNFEGQLGLGNWSAYYTPQELNASQVAVAAGQYHSLAISTLGSLWGWGTGPQVGSANDHEGFPKQVGSDTDWAAIAAGNRHSLGLKAGGTLWAWGYGEDGQLGVLTGSPPAPPASLTTPTQVGTATNWKDMAAGRWHSLGVRTDGSLYAWGKNEYGQLGDGTTTQRTSPVQITGVATGDYNWVAVAAGHYHSLALKADGSLYAWGRNNAGQLGQGDKNDRYTPTLVGTGYAAVAKGEAALHVMTIKKDGSVWCWGGNWFGQLGLGDAGEADPSNDHDRTSPQQLWGPGTMPVTSGGGTLPLELLLQ